MPPLFVPQRHARLHFDGWIAGVGTASGTRVVVGHWARSPFGPFSDVMLERPDGHRLLLAPTQHTADFIAETYTFDSVRVTPVRIGLTAGSWTVSAGSLDLRLTLGRRSLLGFLLSAVPGPIAARPAWTAVTDPLARLLLNVRTHGSGGGRSEWYGVRDLHPITAAAATYEGRELGPLAPVEPPVRFGFGSTPRTPCVVRITTTVEVSGGGSAPRTPPSTPGADRAGGEAPGAGTRSRARRWRSRLLAPGPRRWNHRPRSGAAQTEGTRGTGLDLLGIYLNDHLAGATGGGAGPPSGADHPRYGALMRVAVEAAGWQTHRRLTATEKRLDPQLLDDLLERARRQQDVVEEWRTRQTEAAFRSG